MIIKVKGTRQDKDSKDTHASRGRHETEPEKASNKPLVIGALLCGITAYLRSALPGWSRTSPELGVPETPALEEHPLPIRIAKLPELGALEHDALGPEDAKPDKKSSGGISNGEERSIFVPSKPKLVQVGFERSSGADKLTSLPTLLAVANDNDFPALTAGKSVSRGNPTSDISTAPGPGDDETHPGDNDRNGDDDASDRSTANRAPRISGPVYLNDASGCAAVYISLADLLANAADPDGDALRVSNLTVSHGSLKPSGSGWFFQPDGLGPVTFTYKITDGQHSIHQTAHLLVLPTPPLLGTAGADILSGIECADIIDGGDGDDNIDGRGGQDLINGGAGDDHVVGGAGNDTIYGGAGDDVIYPADGNDYIAGGLGDDRLFGGNGDDIIFGEEGSDQIHGGNGNDALFGGDGDDLIYGDAGDDVIGGNAGNDLLIGDSGDDHLFDGFGEDKVWGGIGDDRIVAAADGQDDIFDGGEGFDIVDYSASEETICFDLIGGAATGVDIGNDRISGIEMIIGGASDDHFLIGNEVTTLQGGDGNDTFEFSVSPPVLGRSQPTHHVILDFEVGDRIRMSKYDIFEKVFDGLENQFEEVYGQKFSEDDARLRFRYEHIDAHDRTVIEVDFDHDEIFETTIYLKGQHALVVVEAV